ncbi:hypothetical protein PRUPE_7G046600 [Prunus persica]|uniref:FAD-binding PCMH-type domain-containing protein n=2 Tax=Prunus persica TaxID=3760 RepID=A0A251N6R7_PRUPE|nr:hypothetical protein PRUPE_7G046600 [Prunus persica]
MWVPRLPRQHLTSDFDGQCNGWCKLVIFRNVGLSSPSASSSASELRKYLGYTALVLFFAAATYYSFPFPENAKHKKALIFRYAPLPEELHTVSTGAGPTRAGMVNLALMDKVLEVDKEKKRVRVQTGIRVQELVDGIKEHGLTLQNFASIREQQIGGILQVGAHGTGPKLPPMDEQVISMKLVTPAKGTIEISKEKDPELFYLAQCGLGGLGVVAEVTIQCVERQELVEHTSISNMEEIKKNQKKLLSENKHGKYLYIPYSDTVVVVTCNLYQNGKVPQSSSPNIAATKPYSTSEISTRNASRSSDPVKNDVDINELSFTELRDKLHVDKDHVVKVNQAEAEFWRKSEGYRVGWSDEILGFDCGGQTVGFRNLFSSWNPFQTKLERP